MAKVTLDTVFEDYDPSQCAGDLLVFISAINKRNIKLSFSGDWANGWPVVTYTGPRKALEKMISVHWGDSDLIRLIKD